MNPSVCLRGPLLVVLVLGSGCGGKDTSTSHSSGGDTGTTNAAGGGPTSDTGGPTTGGPTSGGTSSTTGATSNGGASSSDDASDSAMSNGGTGGTSTGGSSTGGSSAGSSGAGGASCVDACELHGAACCVGSKRCLEPGDSCVLDILSATVGVIYEYDDLEQEISELPSDILISIADTDIAFAAADPSPAARFEFELTPEASELHGPPLDDASIHPFWLSCNGERLFAGVTHVSYGAAAIKTPVLHLGRNNEGRWVLALGAWLGAWLNATSSDPTLAERIDRPELRAAFCQRGALSELDPEAQAPDL